MADVGQREIARRYGVRQQTISQIASGKTWTHVTGRTPYARQERVTVHPDTVWQEEIVQLLEDNNVKVQKKGKVKNEQ